MVTGRWYCYCEGPGINEIDQKGVEHSMGNKDTINYHRPCSAFHNNPITDMVHLVGFGLDRFE